MNEMESWYIKSKCELIRKACDEIPDAGRDRMEKLLDLIVESTIKIENDLASKTTKM